MAIIKINAVTINKSRSKCSNKTMICYRDADLYSNCVLPVPIGSSRNSNFETDVLETHSAWALLPMIFVINIFELTKTARSAFKVLGVGSIGLQID